MTSDCNCVPIENNNWIEECCNECLKHLQKQKEYERNFSKENVMCEKCWYISARKERNINRLKRLKKIYKAKKPSDYFKYERGLNFLWKKDIEKTFNEELARYIIMNCNFLNVCAYKFYNCFYENPFKFEVKKQRYFNNYIHTSPILLNLLSRNKI